MAAPESRWESKCSPQAGRSFVSAVAACLALSHCAPVAQAQSAPVFPISSVIAEVKRELAAAQNVPGAAVDLKLEKVEATLAVSRVVDANGKVSVGVPALGVELGAGGTRKSEDSSTLYVELVPPEPGRALGATETKNFGLTEAIVDTRRELAKGLRDEPRLDPKKVVITVKFGVTQSAGPTGQLKLVVLTVGGGVSVAASDVSTIVLTFAANPGRTLTAPKK